MTKVIATVVNAAGKTVNATMSVRPETVYTSDNITTVPAPVRGDADDKGRIEVEVDASHGGRWAIVINVAGVWAREVRGAELPASGDVQVTSLSAWNGGTTPDPGNPDGGGGQGNAGKITVSDDGLTWTYGE